MHRTLQRELGLTGRVVQTPVTTDRALLLALPRLIEGFDEVVLDVVVVRPAGELAYKTRLRHHTGSGIGALAALTGPAGLTDKHALLGECDPCFAIDTGGVRQRGFDTGGLVIPIGQQVDGEKIDGRGQRRVGFPEVPDVRIGHGYVGGRIDLGDEQAKLFGG